jgi:hypothetical protein
LAFEGPAFEARHSKAIAANGYRFAKPQGKPNSAISE